jgi:hypothetical protein
MHVLINFSAIVASVEKNNIPSSRRALYIVLEKTQEV